MIAYKEFHAVVDSMVMDQEQKKEKGFKEEPKPIPVQRQENES